MNTKDTSTDPRGTLPSVRDHDFYLELPEFDTSVYVYKRPDLQKLMDYLEKEVEAVIFSTAHQTYVDRIMDKIDPERKVFKHRLYQEHCNKIDNKEEDVQALVKDLDLLGRDQSRVVLVDNKAFSFWCNPDNGIVVKEFRGSDVEELELDSLLSLLTEIKGKKDVRKTLEKKFLIRDALRDSNLI